MPYICIDIYIQVKIKSWKKILIQLKCFALRPELWMPCTQASPRGILSYTDTWRLIQPWSKGWRFCSSQCQCLAWPTACWLGQDAHSKDYSITETKRKVWELVWPREGRCHVKQGEGSQGSSKATQGVGWCREHRKATVAMGLAQERGYMGCKWQKPWVLMAIHHVSRC